MTLPVPARLCGAIFCLVFASCVAPLAREQVSSFSDVGEGQVVVVGRVELVPPLAKDEQNFKGMVGSDMVRNKVLLLTDERWRQISGERERAEYKGRIEAPLDQAFFVRSDNKGFYILAGEIWLSAADRAYLPGGLKVDIKPSDRAVYIGTLRYHRNEFFRITKTEIVDDYGRANSEYRRLFGTRFPLRKAMAVPVK